MSSNDLPGLLRTTAHDLDTAHDNLDGALVMAHMRRLSAPYIAVLDDAQRRLDTTSENLTDIATALDPKHRQPPKKERAPIENIQYHLTSAAEALDLAHTDLLLARDDAHAQGYDQPWLDAIDKALRDNQDNQRHVTNTATCLRELTTAPL